MGSRLLGEWLANPLADRAGIEGRLDAVEEMLRDASLAVRRGEVHALMGANGAGKSTLVKILNGAIPPDAGTIAVGGRQMAIHSPMQARRAGIAYYPKLLVAAPFSPVTGVRFLAAPAGRDPNHGERDDGARAAQRHRRPVPLLTAGAELLGRDGELAALAAADAGEPSRARLLEEVLERQHVLSHGRRDSPGRWPCCRRACGSGRFGRRRPDAPPPRRGAA